jgi:hypothetical protein
MSEQRSLIEQMLEHLVNDDQQKAEELFHEYVVRQSREIYENLIESEMADDEDNEDEDKDTNKKDKDVEEGFDEFAEADDEMDLDSEDPTDDLAGELGGDDDMDDMDDEEGDKSPEELFQDLDSIVDELQAKFDAMGGGDDMDDMGDMGDDEPMKDEFELETVREYVEKVPAGHGAEKKGQAEKADGSAGGMKFSKNDMGGTSANILSGRNGADAGLANQGQLKGSGLLKGAPQDMKTGNINVPGAKNGNAFSKKEPGHGAEKKGAAEGSTDGQSLFRGRR